MSEWKTIDSAPKDGSRVVLYNPKYGAGSGHWWNGQEAEQGRLAQEGRWILHFCLNKEAQPTHWTELLPPPNTVTHTLELDADV